MFCLQNHINILKFSTTFQELFHLRNCVYGGMTLILWKDIEEVENFMQDEVFSASDEDKRGWIIVVDNSQFVGQTQ
jgi:hypothetical protein